MRRDEHGIRAKERVLSVRDKKFTWNYNEQTLELWDQYKTELAKEQDQKLKLEEEGKQNEHLKDLIRQMESLEQLIAEKEAQKDGCLESIVVTTKDIWKYVISKRTNIIFFIHYMSIYIVIHFHHIQYSSFHNYHTTFFYNVWLFLI